MRFPFSKKSNQIIAPRVLLLILIFSGIVTLMITAIQINFEYEKDIHALDDQFKRIEAISINPLAQSLWFMNEDSIKLQLDGILNLRDIEYLELVGKGNIFITNGKKVSKHTTERILSLTHKNDSGESIIGKLTVVASKTAIYSRLFDRLITILVSQSIIIFLLSIFIFLIVHHLVIKHLSFISNYLKGIDIEKPHSKIALKRKTRRVKDELDQVVISTNEMIQRQKDSYRKIEQVVKKRTAELTQKNEQLRKERQKAQKYLDVAGVMLVALNTSGEIALINKQGCKLLKTSETEAIGKNWFDHFLPKRKVDEVKGVFEQLMSGNIKPVEKYENPVRTSHGDERIVAFNNTLLIGSNNRIEGVLFSGEDISDRKRLESQLQQSQKMEAIGTLAGGIAHDFNNILAVILGNAELAADDIPPGNPAGKSLKAIHQASIRAKDMVRQLLAFSRKSDEETRLLNMTPIVKESMKMLRSAVPTSVEFKQHISGDVCNILGDAAQINQIMMNLVTNASHAMSQEGGLLEVTLEKIMLQEEKTCFDWVLTPGPYVRLKVRDTGEGIEPEIMARIFEPYFTTKEVGKGTGMGLSVIHGIMKRHNGGIRVESELGEGTVFEIYFPALEKTIEEEKEPDEEIEGGSERILFVDDEESMVNLNQQRLERLGYNVIPKTDPLEALEFFRTNPDQIDLIISDMTMPHMTGDKLAQEIRNIRSDMPIIICTGYSERMSENIAQEIGIRKYIEKPIEMANLARSVREVLDETRS